jgi:hypothetical protein
MAYARCPIEGVEYELINHQLTLRQSRIYGAYAGAFLSLEETRAFS